MKECLYGVFLAECGGVPWGNLVGCAGGKIREGDVMGLGIGRASGDSVLVKCRAVHVEAGPMLSWTVAYGLLVSYGCIGPLAISCLEGGGMGGVRIIGQSGALACFALALCAWRRGPRGIPPRLQSVFLACGALGPFLLVARLWGGSGLGALALPGLVAMGLFVGSMTVVVLSMLPGNPMRRIVVALVAANVGGSAVGGIVGISGSCLVANISLLVASAAVSALVWRMGKGLGGGAVASGEGLFAVSQDGEGEEPVTSRFPVRPLSLMALVALVSSSMRAGVSSEWDFVSYAGGLICALAVLLAILRKPDRSQFRFLYYLALFFLLVALYLFAAEDELLRLGALVFGTGGYVAFYVFTIAVFSNICDRYGLEPVWMFGLLEGVSHVAIDLGYRFGEFAIGLSWRDLLCVSFLLAIFVTMAFILLLTEHDYKTSWGTVKEESPFSPIADYYEELPQRCLLASQQYGLSRRERDILLLLAQRKTAGEIERELYVSNATVKTHTRNIYKKMGVHKKEELLATLGHPSAGR